MAVDEDQIVTVNVRKKKKDKFQENAQPREADMGDSLQAAEDQNKMQSSMLNGFGKGRNKKRNADANYVNLSSEGLVHKFTSEVQAEAEEFDNEKQSSVTIFSETKKKTKKKLKDHQVEEDAIFFSKGNVEMITVENEVNARESGSEMQLSLLANNEKKNKKKKIKKFAVEKYNGLGLFDSTTVDSTKEAEIKSGEGCNEMQFSLEKGKTKNKRRKKSVEAEDITCASDVILEKTIPDDETDRENRLLRVEYGKKKKEKGRGRKRHESCPEGILNDKTDENHSKLKAPINDTFSKKESVSSEDGNPDPSKSVDVIANSQSKEKRKRVSFSGNVEVFPLNNSANDQEDESKVGLVQGKRFSPEEDEMIKKAISKYIEAHCLGEEGLHKVLHSQKYPEVKGCWKEIGESLPWRPFVAVRKRGDILFKRSEIRKWTPEEIEMIQRHHEAHGSKWSELAQMLGKHRIHLKDAYRRTKLKQVKKGRWSQDEYQNLFDLVNLDLRMKVSEEKYTKHGMLRENISWEAISEKMATRHQIHACLKWYHSLASPMVNTGLWADRDDYLLVDTLLKLDACCIEDIDWDNILKNRSGEICRKRWIEMSKHIGGYRERSFMEQVELLATRYSIEMLEHRTGTADEEEEQ